MRICHCFPSFLFSGPWGGVSGPAVHWYPRLREWGQRGKQILGLLFFLSLCCVLLDAAEAVMLFPFISKGLIVDVWVDPKK